MKSSAHEQLRRRGTAGAPSTRRVCARRASTVCPRSSKNASARRVDDVGEASRAREHGGAGLAGGVAQAGRRLRRRAHGSRLAVEARDAARDARQHLPGDGVGVGGDLVGADGSPGRAGPPARRARRPRRGRRRRATSVTSIIVMSIDTAPTMGARLPRTSTCPRLAEPAREAVGVAHGERGDARRRGALARSRRSRRGRPPRRRARRRSRCARA